jgi:adenylate cyclase
LLFTLYALLFTAYITTANQYVTMSRQLTAIMFVDIVGYTSMVEEDERRALQFRDKFLNKLKSEVSLHDGKIYDLRGDGAFCCFNSATEAVNAALALQLEMQEEPKVPVRIGIHQGEVNISENEVHGSVVNIASRIESFAIPGSILISGKVYDDIKNQKEIETLAVGRYKLKFVKEPIDLFALKNPGLEIPKKGKLEGKGLLYDRHWRRLKWIAWLSLAITVIALTFWLTKNKDTDLSPFSQPASIAVLYFENMSGDPEKEYFSDGITEEIISHISRIEGMRVISRSAVLHFKGKAIDLSQIAKDLRVSSILEGSVRLDGNIFRISAKMIDAKSEEYIWSETYDGELENIFEVQQQIAEQIADALKVDISSTVSEKLKAIPTKVVEAYNAFQKGKFILYRIYYNTHKGNDFLLAKHYFEKAIELDANYAEAYAGLAELYDEVRNHSLFLDSLGHPNDIAFHDSLNRITLNLARHAIKLNPESPYALTAMAWAIYHKDDTAVDSAMYFLTNAYRHAPGDPLNALNLGFALVDFFGLHKEAIPFFLQALETDPLDPNLYCLLGNAYMFIGQHEEGRKAIQSALDLANDQINTEATLLRWLTYFNELDIVQQRLSSYTGETDYLESFFYATIKQPEKIHAKFKNDPVILHVLKRDVIQEAVLTNFEIKLEEDPTAPSNYNLLQNSNLYKAYHANPRFKAILAKSKSIHDQYQKKYGKLRVIH